MSIDPTRNLTVEQLVAQHRAAAAALLRLAKAEAPTRNGAARLRAIDGWVADRERAERELLRRGQKSLVGSLTEESSLLRRPVAGRPELAARRRAVRTAIASHLHDAALVEA